MTHDQDDGCRGSNGDRGSDKVPLRAYVDVRLAAMDRAVDKAEERMSERLMGMNELRDQLRDQAARFLTRAEMEAAVGPLSVSRDALRDQVVRCVTRDELQAALAPLAAQLEEMVLFRADHQGRASTGSVFVAYALALLSLIITIVDLLLRLR